MIELLRGLPAAYPSVRRWVVAFSGGMDSHVLLHLCATFRARDAQAVPAVHALHVDHGVHPRSASWAEHCAQVCAGFGIPLHQTQLRADFSGGRHSENRLREARYRVFEEFCANDDLLLLAHHRDDQAETMLLRLVRGAGVTGLSGMPVARDSGVSRLHRPLLSEPRSRLREYAESHDLRWIEDPSNLGLDYARNFLRARILPALESRWPGVSERIARSADHCAEAAEICAAVAASDLRDCSAIDRFAQPCLSLERWRALPPARAANLLRAWLGARAGAAIAARTRRTVETELIGARVDAHARLRLGDHEVRRFRDHLYMLDGRVEQATRPAEVVVAPGFDAVVAGVGRVALDASRHGGIRAGSHYAIRFRSAGVVCKLPGRPRKRLKQLLQELEVPPWLRERLPLLYVDGELAAVAHLCVCESFVAGPGENAVSVRWEPHTASPERSAESG